jgi:predicted transcriptional regulator
MRRREGDLVSHRRSLSSDAKVLIALLKKQPQDIEALCKSASVSISTFYRIRPLLEGRGIIKRTGEGYALSTYSVLEEKVKRAVDDLRHEYRFFREPTVKEVAENIGEPLKTMSSLLYKLIPETGWKEQEKEQAKKEAEESINLAGWLKWLKRGDEHGEYFPAQIEELNSKAEQEKQQARKEVIKRARMILKNYPKLVPEAKPRSPSAPAGLDPWPEETNRVWYRVFQQEAPKSGREGIYLKSF